MSNPNTIPEFLGIIVVTIVVLSVLGVLISMAFEGTSKSVKKKLKTNSRPTLSSESIQRTHHKSNFEIMQGYTLPAMPNKFITRMKPILVEQMFNLAVERHQKNPLKGTPLESIAILETMNETSEIFKKELMLKRREVSLMEKEVVDLVDESYKIVYNKFFNK